MNVLIAAATRHGSTDEIAQALAGVLREAGLDVTTRSPDDVSSVGEYDAVVVGSAVYAGKWLDPARTFVERHVEDLRSRPVWLFSSGPLGDPPRPREDAVDVAPLQEMVQARGHRTFAGNLERGELGFGERAVVRLVRAPYGDFRDWPAIREWGESIARELSAAS